eukprot:11047031-Heterocapsa_arctica.AAC.1
MIGHTSPTTFSTFSREEIRSNRKRTARVEVGVQSQPRPLGRIAALAGRKRPHERRVEGCVLVVDREALDRVGGGHELRAKPLDDRHADSAVRLVLVVLSCDALAEGQAIASSAVPVDGTVVREVRVEDAEDLVVRVA